MEAYPKPHDFNWSYNQKNLTNTTDHVITTHSYAHRYAHEYVHVLTYQLGGGVLFSLPGGMEMFYCCFYLYSYHSQLKLVRLKVSESGVYTFLANNGDASIRLTFEVHVLSKFLRNRYRCVMREEPVACRFCFSKSCDSQQCPTLLLLQCQIAQSKQKYVHTLQMWLLCCTIGCCMQMM